jgi:hypothetical protein
MQSYHFPPPDAQPPHGYSNPQLLAPQQWPQHEPQPYEINYQAYGADQGPFRHGGHGQHGQHGQHQGYGDSDDFGDGYYEDEEPRRGKRWLLIAAALVGAIGVGGALAYTYRSIVAPKSRLVATKTEPKVKAGVERPPVKVVEETPKAPEAPAAEDPPPGGGEQGARKVKTIPVAPQVPGIILYKPPEATTPPAPKEKTPVPSAKETVKDDAEPPGRLAVVTPPEPEAKEAKDKDDEEETPVTPPPSVSKKSQTALATPKPPPQPKAKETPSAGLGFVVVLKSAKTHMEAMTTYADMQQKYPDVLGATSFEVQEADLGAKGVWHRVVVGPPGSRNWASGVCAQLKAAGYVGCWVKEY